VSRGHQGEKHMTPNQQTTFSDLEASRKEAGNNKVMVKYFLGWLLGLPMFVLLVIYLLF
jgi:hypothetical protein